MSPLFQSRPTGGAGEGVRGDALPGRLHEGGPRHEDRPHRGQSSGERGRDTEKEGGRGRVNLHSIGSIILIALEGSQQRHVRALSIHPRHLATTAAVQ